MTSTNTPAGPRRPKGRWYAAGTLLAAAAGAGVGHLVAGFVAPESSPVLAVGSTVIDLTPTPVKEWAVAQFGTADKPILIGSVAIVTLLAAGAIGLVARSRRPVGLALLGALAFLAMVAASLRPTSGPVDVIPGLVTVGCRRRRRLVVPRSPRPLGRRRRRPDRRCRCRQLGALRRCGRPAPRPRRSRRPRRPRRQWWRPRPGPHPWRVALLGGPARGRRAARRPAEGPRGHGPRHLGLPDPERRLLPDRHRARHPARLGRRLEADHRRRRRQALRDHLRGAPRDADGRARHHAHLRLQRGRRAPTSAAPAGSASAPRTSSSAPASAAASTRSSATPPRA